MATSTKPRVEVPIEAAPAGDPALVEGSPEQVVRQAIEQAKSGVPKGEPSRWARALPKLWLVAYLVLFGALAIAYPLIGSGTFGLPREWSEVVRKIAYVALMSVVVRAVSTAVEVVLIERIEDAVARFNLVKVIHLVGWLAIGFVALTQLAADWYAAAASLGLVSLILGLALQEPISSFFAWIYILLRGPYRVGDRIQIGEVTGDVINVGYLDTTVWEVGGPYLSGDHPSGRLVKFPNSRVFGSPVFNYSWPLFPYIWSEIKLHIAYDSDLDFVAKTMQDVVTEDMGELMMQRVGQFRELLAQTPVDELNVRERPAVTFRVSDNTWLEAIVRYVVNPKESGRVRARLLPKLLARLNAEPERVMFPKSNMR
jgi:small-conductance mechanosensitive channel